MAKKKKNNRKRSADCPMRSEPSEVSTIAPDSIAPSARTDNEPEPIKGSQDGHNAVSSSLHPEASIARPLFGNDPVQEQMSSRVPSWTDIDSLNPSSASKKSAPTTSGQQDSTATSSSSRYIESPCHNEHYPSLPQVPVGQFVKGTERCAGHPRYSPLNAPSHPCRNSNSFPPETVYIPRHMTRMEDSAKKGPEYDDCLSSHATIPLPPPSSYTEPCNPDTKMLLEINTLKESLNIVKEDLDNSLAYCEKIKHERDTYYQDLTHQINASNMYQEELQRRVNQHHELQQVVADFQTTAGFQRTQVKLLEEQVEMAHTKIRQLSRDALASNAFEMEREVKGLFVRFASVEKKASDRINTLAGQLLTSQHHLKKRDDQILELKKMIKDRDERIQTLQEDRENLQSQCKNLENKTVSTASSHNIDGKDPQSLTADDDRKREKIRDGKNGKIRMMESPKVGTRSAEAVKEYPPSLPPEERNTVSTKTSTSAPEDIPLTSAPEDILTQIANGLTLRALQEADYEERLQQLHHEWDQLQAAARNLEARTNALKSMEEEASATLARATSLAEQNLELTTGSCSQCSTNVSGLNDRNIRDVNPHHSASSRAYVHTRHHSGIYRNRLSEEIDSTATQDSFEMTDKKERHGLRCGSTRHGNENIENRVDGNLVIFNSMISKVEQSLLNCVQELRNESYE